MRSVNLLFLFGIRGNLPEEWKESIIVLVCKKGEKTGRSDYRGVSLLPTVYKFYPTSCGQG
jgi:hypothetical protein